MRALLLLLLFLACAPACVAPDEATDEQDLHQLHWDTVDSFTHGGLGAGASGLAVRNNALLVVGGFGMTPQATVLTVRTSTDGVHFATDTEYAYPGSRDNWATRVGVDPVGRVYVAGAAIDGAGASHMITLMSPTGTGGYSLVDDVPVGSVPYADATSIVSYRSGAIVLGYGGSTSRARYTLDGVTWADVPLPPSATIVYGLCLTGVGFVATGRSTTGDGVTYASSDPVHVPWTLVDRWPGGTGVRCHETLGGVFVAAYDPNLDWVMRRASSNLTGWAFDDVTYEGNAPAAISAGPFNTTLVTGRRGTGTTVSMLTRARTSSGLWGDFDTLPAESYGTDLSYSSFGLYETSWVGPANYTAVVRVYH